MRAPGDPLRPTKKSNRFIAPHPFPARRTVPSAGGEGAEAFAAGGDPLVGRGEGDADVVAALVAVEAAGADEDAALGGEQLATGPAVKAWPGGPQVKARLGVLDVEPGRGQGGRQDVAP